MGTSFGSHFNCVCIYYKALALMNFEFNKSINELSIESFVSMITYVKLPRELELTALTLMLFDLTRSSM